MPDPVNPTGPTPASAAAAVERVIAWYSREIDRERRAVAPDEKRLEHLKVALRASAADQRKLEDADAQEADRIAVHYAALHEELMES
ncbi:hypothetical protein [Streptomyces alboflavus]|uniref:hypothetical protein n=1 Tax=Streptomyces alboflavus TaxID=67267 RepID=UPI0036CB147A